MSGETVYRTDLAEPDYGDDFQNAVHTWLAARLRAVLSDPNALPPEADIFREIRPFGSLEAAAVEAGRRNRSILAFVYDPTQPERGKLRWALDCFLYEPAHARDIMNGAFVTALVRPPENKVALASLRRPDILFERGALRLTADVTAVSDEGLDKDNPYHELSSTDRSRQEQAQAAHRRSGSVLPI